MTIRSYSPKNVILVVDGRPITSWTKASMELDEDDWKFTTAATGEPTRTRIESILGTVSFALPQTSADNKLFAELSAADSSKGVLPPFTHSVHFEDSWGNTIATMSNGTFMKRPAANFEADAQDTAWSLKGECDELIVAGNNLATSQL